MTIQAIAIRSNAELMAECAELGYLDGTVLDMTYGMGAFWRRHEPQRLIAMDRYVTHRFRLNVLADATCLPFDNRSVDSAVFDPPYKLNGTSTDIGPSMLDARYGVGGSYTPAAVRHALLLDGTSEALRVARRYVLVKCADQISSGKYNAQTFMVWNRAMEHGATMVDMLHVMGSREQPYGTRQLHARRNYSSLLVFAV